MHEMSLAESVLAIIEDYAQREGFARVKTVRLEIGRMAGVEIEAMRFCFDAVTRGSVAEAAALDIVELPGAGWCLKCSEAIEMEEPLGACPRCGSHQVQVTGGAEMRVRELEVA
jgi:hydrogenase nickel incorporation protein HypA/HybF